MLTAAALCLVVAISDGDTLKARCGEEGAYRVEVVRLAEIDAPEKGQAFGQRSRWPRHQFGILGRQDGAEIQRLRCNENLHELLLFRLAFFSFFYSGKIGVGEKYDNKPKNNGDGNNNSISTSKHARPPRTDQ